MKKNTICQKNQFLLKVVIFLFFFIGTAWGETFSPEFVAEIEKKYGDYAKRRLIAWQKLSSEYKNSDEIKKIEAVNNFFNLFEYKTPQEHWGKADYWETPLEFVVSGAGNCQDFTVAKYFTLLDLGVPDEKMLITYVKALNYNQAHMVLSYYPTPGGTPLILDNLNKELLPADQRKDLQPIYAFNGKGLWEAKQLGVGNKIGASTDIKRWVELEGRMKAKTIGNFNK